MTLARNIQKYISLHRLFHRGERVIVGVSGGPDSVFLLNILHTCRHELGIQIIAAHFNHHLHKNADADQKFTAALAQNLNVPFFTARWSAKTKKGSLENVARKARFAFLKQVAQTNKTSSIALAHTADDLAETVMMRLCRGSGLQGMRGILPKRSIDNFVIIRPLLHTTKKDILKYLKQKRIQYHVDPTNTNEAYFRNKIRHKLLPLLKKEYNPSIETVLQRLSAQTTIDYDYLETQARKIFNRFGPKSPQSSNISIPLVSLKKQHLAVQHMFYRLVMEHLQGDLTRFTYTHCREIDDMLQNRPAGSIVHLPHKIYFQKKTGTLLASVRK